MKRVKMVLLFFKHLGIEELKIVTFGKEEKGVKVLFPTSHGDKSIFSLNWLSTFLN